MLGASWAEGERDGVPYAYTRPSPARYPWQWYWDSCFAAIVWRRFDPSRSRAELETLLRACRPDGFVGHVIFWDHPISLPAQPLLQRRLALGADDRDDPAAAPGLGVANRGRRSGGRAAHRPPPRVAASPTATSTATGCCGSCSPTSRGSTPRPSSTRCGAGGRTRGLGFPLLVARNRRLGWDARRVRDAGGPVLCEVVTNVLWGLARLAMGEPSITPALVDRLWDERLGLFLDEAQPGRPAPRGRDLGRAGAARPARPAGGDRAAPGRGASARPEALLAARCLRPRSRPPSRASSRGAGRAGSAATGAGRPGSTPPGCCGSGWSGSATATRPTQMAAPAGRDRAPRGPARVLQPPHRRGPRRHRLRLDQPRSLEMADPAPAGRPELPVAAAALAARCATCSGR